MVTSRKLSVILAADAVGYSRMAEADETGARAAVAWFRQRFEEIVGSHGGRVFSRAGDGFMAEAPTAQAGVRAALEFSETVRARVANTTGPALQARVAVHLGDAFAEADGDMMGHDVNVAARIEGVTGPGEVFVSRAVAEAARGIGDARFERVGRERMKNLAEPIEVFRVTRASASRRLPPLPIAGVAAGVLAVVALAFVAIDRFRSDAPDFPPQEQASIAVLPFADMSPEGDQEYFSDGLAEELLNQLAQLEELRVIARTSSFMFKGQNTDVREIGARLGVAHVLEGSVRRSGDRLRITAQLISARDGSHLWSQTYDRQLDDVFAIQDDIAASVADALSVALGVASAPRARGTDSFEAYDAYLRGCALVDAGRNPDAIEQLERAVTIDPDFAAPWAVMARAYGSIATTARAPDTRALALAEMERTALRSVEMAPDLWESQLALGSLRLTQHRWIEADQAMTRARVLSQRDGANLGQTYWGHLLNFGRLEEMLAVAEEELRVDPLAPNAASGVENVLYMLGRRDAPAEGAGPVDIMLRYTMLLDRGDYAAARELWAAVAEDGGQSSITGPLAPVLSDVLQAPQGVLTRVRAAAEASENQASFSLAMLAVAAESFGDPEYAVELLRRAYLPSEAFNGYWFIWLPALEEARATEAFKEFLRDLGYVDYWRETGDWGHFCRPRDGGDIECD